MDEHPVLEVLEAGTLRVLGLEAGRLTPTQFVEEYGAFYHHSALDGHEATPEDRAVLRENADACRLHAEVQAIVDKIYDSAVPLAEYERAGRLLPGEAARQIIEVARRHDASGVLARVRARLRGER